MSCLSAADGSKDKCQRVYTISRVYVSAVIIADISLAREASIKYMTGLSARRGDEKSREGRGSERAERVVRMQPRLMRVSCQRGRRSYSDGKGVALSPTTKSLLLRQRRLYALLTGEAAVESSAEGTGEGEAGHVFPGSRLPTVVFLHAYIAMLA